MQKNIFYLVVAFILSFSFTAVQAQESDKKAYIGISGIVGVEVYDEYSNASFEAEGTGWLITYGYQFTDMVGAEFSYGQFSDDEANFILDEDAYDDVEAGDYVSNLEISVMEMSLLARIPSPSQVSPFLRFGYSDADFQLWADFNERSLATRSEGSLFVGAGVDLSIEASDAIDAAIRFEYNKAGYDGLVIERLQIGTIIRF